MKDVKTSKLIAFCRTIASEQGNAVKKFSGDAVKLLQEYDWTGNIRELRNVVERLIILGGLKFLKTT
jgi:DNA-binding NtrC family response regulator